MPIATAIFQQVVFELLGTAAWWAGQPDRATDALERAFAGFEEAGSPEDAARVALALGYEAYRRFANAVGEGWAARAQTLLRDRPDSKLHAHLEVYEAIGALMEGRIEDGLGARPPRDRARPRPRQRRRALHGHEPGGHGTRHAGAVAGRPGRAG